jgi:hypothetical protein
MNEIANRRFSAVFVGVAIGFCVGFGLLIVAFFATFTICSDTSIAKLLFPFAILADPSLGDRWWLALCAALVQYPIYIGLIAFVRSRKPSMLWLTIIGLCVLHFLGMTGAASREKALHDKIWQRAQVLATAHRTDACN